MMSFAGTRVPSTSFPRRREPKFCKRLAGAENLGPGLRRGDGLKFSGDAP
jgi:hypothetical protein